MTVDCHSDLRHLALAAAVVSPASFSVQGQLVEPGAEMLLRFLESELYRRLYCGAVPLHSPQTEDPAESAAFVGALSRANQGGGTWEPGWTIGGGAPDDRVTVTRDGVTFWVERSKVRTSSGSLTPGERCAIRIGKEMRHLLYGFYLAQGDLHPDDTAAEPVPLVRLYWHLTPGAAAPYVQEATGRLNGASIPFQTKVLANPRQYVRRDSGVLYLRRADFDRAAPVLQAIYQTVRAGLLPAVPLFTKPLAPGLGLAEDPKGGVSFGQSRCRIAAQGLWQAHLQGLTDPEARLGAIVEAFRSAGIDPAYPYLEPGSVDRYHLDPESGEGGE